MYIVKPESNHENVVLDFVSRCEFAGDAVVDVFGSVPLTEKLQGEGYASWLKQVQANALSREWHSSCGLEPGSTVLLVERMSGNADVSEEYLQQFPMISADECLVGIVTFRTVLEDSDKEADGGVLMRQSRDRTSTSAILTLCLLPSYRDTVNYILALTDVMTYTVCEGLPYKTLVYWLANDAKRSVVATALQSCNFDYKSTDSATNEDVYWADLRMAHQLKGRICAFDRKEE